MDIDYDVINERSEHHDEEIVIDDRYRSLADPVLKRPPDEGLGIGGTAARILDLSPGDKKIQEDSIEKYAINHYISEKISLHRSLKDKRHEK